MHFRKNKSRRMNESTIKWRRRFLWLLAWAIGSTLFCTFRETRGILIRPLTVHDDKARGELAYVMADGAAYWERLRAASDLFHQHRITSIYVFAKSEIRDGTTFASPQTRSSNARLTF